MSPTFGQQNVTSVNRLNLITETGLKLRSCRAVNFSVFNVFKSKTIPPVRLHSAQQGSPPAEIDFQIKVLISLAKSLS